MTGWQTALSFISSGLRLLGLVCAWVPTYMILQNTAPEGGTVHSVALFTLLPTAFYASHRIFRLRFFDDPPMTHFEERRIRSIDAHSARDLMALLNEEDLDDLRNEVRESLRARIRRLSDSDEPESFGDLLAEPSAKRKRGVR